jgi:Uma2 family endonuclease
MATTFAQPELLLRSPEADWNAARWATLGDDGNRYEVIAGVLYMSTAPSVVHQLIIRQTARVLFAQVDDAGLGVTLWSPIGVFMPGCDPVQPDLLVVGASDLGILTPERINGVPALIVEVLSPSNASYDLVTKRDAYARAGVPEYWILNPTERAALVYAAPEAGVYRVTRTFAAGVELVAVTLPVRTPVAALFAGVPSRAD